MSPEQKLEYMRKWRADHPGYTKMKSAEWRKNNLERKRELERNAYHANPEPYRLRQKQYQLRTLDKFAERSAKWDKANHAGVLLRAARQRAKQKGLPFDIEVSDIVIPEFCPILGVPLARGDGRKMGNSATLDRIVNDLGYVKGNVWVISNKANIMKSNANLEELKRFGEWINHHLNGTKED